MRRRQLKKFAKRLPRDKKAYDEAHKGGSKRLWRRLKCFKRYWRNTPPSPATLRIRALRQMVEAIQRNTRELMAKVACSHGGWPDAS